MRVAWRIDWINWPIHSHQTAMRNAQRASVICAQRRREREAVDDFLATLSPAPGR